MLSPINHEAYTNKMDAIRKNLNTAGNATQNYACSYQMKQKKKGFLNDRLNAINGSIHEKTPGMISIDNTKDLSMDSVRNSTL